VNAPTDPSRRRNLAAVVLAAGSSTRMGQPKALLDLDGRPVIARLVETLQSVDGMGNILIVTGHAPGRIHIALDGSDVTFVHNMAYESGGMLSSVQVGAKTIADSCDAFFLCLLDQPLVLRRTLETLAKAWQSTRMAIVLPAHDGKRGHPILIASRCAHEIVSLPPDSTLRDFVAQHRNETEVIEVNDPGVRSDLDTPADYQLVLSMWRTLKCPTGPIPSEPA
jgi:CTP:molybdopterin cytidylyltransferase MocA